METPADICIYGGAAGGGKTFGLLLGPMRHKNVPGFGCTIFRSTYKQVFAQGGLWDESMKMFGDISGAQPRYSDGQWWFRNKDGQVVSKIIFAHLERENQLKDWQGSQICCLCFDELTHFTEKIFFYMLSRNRSTCGVKPYVRATCNPDADSWVAKFISWWIDQDTGYPIPERSGKLRFFYRDGEKLHWASSRKKLWEKFNLVTEEERFKVKSVTFIMSTLDDNQELLRIDPGYKANLEALPIIERERLLKGNWKIKAAAGLYFKRVQLGNVLEVLPADIVQYVRCWDLAATSQDQNGDAAYTAGVLMGKRKDGRYIVIDVVRKQMNAMDVRNTIRLTAQADRAKYRRVRVRLPKDPGQAGKAQAESYIKFLSGFDVTTVAETGSKEARAEPMAAQWQAGNFDIMHGDWNDAFLLELENFPEGQFKDQVDAAANAFAEIESRAQFSLANFM